MISGTYPQRSDKYSYKAYIKIIVVLNTLLLNARVIWTNHPKFPTFQMFPHSCATVGSTLRDYEEISNDSSFTELQRTFVKKHHMGQDKKGLQETKKVFSYKLW